jgi:hypothetical protein
MTCTLLVAVAWGTREYVTRASGPPTIVTIAAPSPPAPPLPEPTVQEPEGIKVDLILFPLDARVYRGEEDLGQMPVSVYVKEGEKLTLLVKRDGYWPRRLVLDGTKQRVVVGLRKYTFPSMADHLSDESDAGGGEDSEDTEDAEQTGAAPGAAAASVEAPQPLKPSDVPGPKPQPDAAGTLRENAPAPTVRFPPATQ